MNSWSMNYPDMNAMGQGRVTEVWGLHTTLSPARGAGRGQAPQNVLLGRSSRTEPQTLLRLKHIKERREGSWSDSSTVRIITAKIRTGWKTGAFYK